MIIERQPSPNVRRPRLEALLANYPYSDVCLVPNTSGTWSDRTYLRKAKPQTFRDRVLGKFASLGAFGWLRLPE